MASSRFSQSHRNSFSVARGPVGSSMGVSHQHSPRRRRWPASLEKTAERSLSACRSQHLPVSPPPQIPLGWGGT